MYAHLMCFQSSLMYLLLGVNVPSNHFTHLDQPYLTHYANDTCHTCGMLWTMLSNTLKCAQLTAVWVMGCRALTVQCTVIWTQCIVVVVLVTHSCKQVMYMITRCIQQPCAWTASNLVKTIMVFCSVTFPHCPASLDPLSAAPKSRASTMHVCPVMTSVEDH